MSDDWKIGRELTDAKTRARSPLERLGDAAIKAIEKTAAEGVEAIILLGDVNAPDGDPTGRAICLHGITSPIDALARLFNAAQIILEVQGVPRAKALEVVQAMVEKGKCS